eukprot:9229111-Alexandrium_andersonii.AAC.1
MSTWQTSGGSRAWRRTRTGALYAARTPGGPAGPESTQWPGCGHLFHRPCADGIRAFAGGQA